MDGQFKIALYNPDGNAAGYAFNGGGYGGATETSVNTAPDFAGFGLTMDIDRADTYTYYAVDKSLERVGADKTLVVTAQDIEQCTGVPTATATTTSTTTSTTLATTTTTTMPLTTTATTTTTTIMTTTTKTTASITTATVITATTTTTTTVMDAGSYCALNTVDDGACDYHAVQAAIAKDQGFSETAQKVEILCHMLRVGFSLEDAYKAGFDAVDCDSASRREACNDVGSVFTNEFNDACVPALPVADESGSPKGNAAVTTAIIVSTVVVALIVLTVVFLLEMPGRNKDGFAEVERRAGQAPNPKRPRQVYSNPAYERPESNSYNGNDADC